MDLQVGGSSFFNVNKSGVITFGGPTNQKTITAGQFTVTMNGSVFDSNFINQSSSAGSFRISSDVILARDAANIFGQRNGTSAQTFRLYNTYTDASNYERGFFRWNTNVLEIGAEAAGTGTQRQTRVLCNATNNSVALGNTSIAGFGVNGDGSPAIVVSSSERFSVSASLLALQNDANFGISFSSGLAFQADTFIRRDGTGNTLAMRNGTSAQTFRLYNTYTDASNYERGFFRWNTNVLEIGAEAAGTGTQRQLRIPLGTVTASTPLSVTQTWNSGGVTFTGILANITDTASASASLLMDLQVGGSSVFKVTKAGRVDITQNLVASFLETSNVVINYASGGVSIGSATQLGWSATTTAAGTQDLRLVRDAAYTLAQRFGTNAQAFKLYRTYTDASNYERLGLLATNTTRYTITSENAGTGSARSLEVSFYTSASDPTSSDITSGCFSVWKNSGTSIIKLWANDGGTMKSVALV
jgi:hypothetical protein